ncbi:MAG: sugar ABC transporter ATP-binding protein [Hyphomicrobiaceae bacterium]
MLATAAPAPDCETPMLPVPGTAREGPLLDVRGLTKRFGAAVALSGASLQVAWGERHALVGENGAGKSTLIKLLAGHFPPDGGSIHVDGQPYAPASPAAASRQGLAVVHQELSIIADLTVAENIYLGNMPTLRLGRVDRQRLTRDTQAVLDRLGLGLEPGTLAGALSVAQQQMLEIARGVARQARLLILDEPTSSLGPSEATRLWRLVDELQRQGTAIVFVTHKLDEVLAHSERVTVLRDGRTVGSAPTAELDAGRLVSLMVGRDLVMPDRDAPTSPGPALLQVTGLTRAPAFREVSFAARAGEIVGFGGLVGAGRSEVMRAILGVDRYDQGQVQIAGRALPPGDPRAAIAAGLGFVSENRKSEGIFANLGVRENMCLPGALTNGLGGLRLTAERRLAQDNVAKFAIATRSLEQSIATLSGGNQQKVMLARWLTLDPQVLIVDEPTRGIDVGAKQEIHALLRRHARAGRAVIVVSSDMPELLSLADRIIVMRGGQIVGEVDGKAATERAVGDLALGA